MGCVGLTNSIPVRNILWQPSILRIFTTTTIYINQILLFSRNAQLGSALKFVLLQLKLLNALMSSDRQRAAGARRQAPLRSDPLEAPLRSDPLEGPLRSDPLEGPLRSDPSDMRCAKSGGFAAES
jgi:hypothetical protein